MATKSTVDVRVGGQSIGTVEVVSFDSVSEAESAIGAADVLKLVNRGLKNEATNRVRVAHAQNTPEKEIARLARESKRGTISKSDAASRIRELLSQLDK